MSKEAAERLRGEVRQWAMALNTEVGVAVLRVMDEYDAALAAERKATVERIRNSLNRDGPSDPIWWARVKAILDAEAAR